MFLTASLFASKVFGDDTPCHYTIKKTADKQGEVACYGCEKMSDYAMYGAGHLVRNGAHYKSLTVKNGDNHVRVEAESHIVSTPLSISVGPVSWNMEWNDRTYQAITAHVERGSVSGMPWHKQPVADSVASAKCEAIPEEEEEAIEEMKKKAEEEQSNDASSGSGSPILPIDMQLQMQAALRDMIKHGAFRGWHYRGGVFGPREFLGPCHGIYTADGSGTRCYKG
jgi:hypothetical protein